nr:NAD-dependent epimerase/dehydratase family protein [Actinomycetota bacterium]
MNVLISGATGFLGGTLIPELEAGGHRVTRLTRSPKSADDLGWDPEAGTIDDLEGTDAVVHLAGESIAEGRWTPGKKRRILESRRKGTRLLSEAIAALSAPPSVMVSASAVGYYGDRGNELLTEESDPGSGFLAEVCRDWEAAAEPAREAGIRVVHPRVGIV